MIFCVNLRPDGEESVSMIPNMQLDTVAAHRESFTFWKAER